MGGEALYDNDGARLILGDGAWAIADAAGACEPCCGQANCDGVVLGPQTCNVLVPCVDPTDAACPGCTVLPDSTLRLDTLSATYANGAHVTGLSGYPATLTLLNPGTGTLAFPSIANSDGAWWSGDVVLRVLFRAANGWAQNTAEVTVPMLARARALASVGGSNIEWSLAWKVNGLPANAIDVQVNRTRSDGSTRTYTIGLRIGLSQSGAAAIRTTGCGPCDGTPMPPITGVPKVSAYVVALQGQIGTPQGASTATLWTSAAKMSPHRTGKTSAECVGCVDVMTCTLTNEWTAELKTESLGRTESSLTGFFQSVQQTQTRRVAGKVVIRWNAAAPNVIDVAKGSTVHGVQFGPYTNINADGTRVELFDRIENRITVNADNCLATSGGPKGTCNGGVLNNLDWCGVLPITAFGVDACARPPGNVERYGLDRWRGNQQSGACGSGDQIESWAFLGVASPQLNACLTIESQDGVTGGLEELSIEKAPPIFAGQAPTLLSTSAPSNAPLYNQSLSPQYVYRRCKQRTRAFQVSGPDVVTYDFEDVTLTPAWTVSKAAGCFRYTGSHATSDTLTDRKVYPADGGKPEEIVDEVTQLSWAKSVQYKLTATGLFGTTTPPLGGGDGTHAVDCAQSQARPSLRQALQMIGRLGA